MVVVVVIVDAHNRPGRIVVACCLRVSHSLQYRVALSKNRSDSRTRGALGAAKLVLGAEAKVVERQPIGERLSRAGLARHDERL